MFSFPDVHPNARLTVEFKRTLRVPDDGKIYPLPTELGNLPLRHVDDYANGVPSSWVTHGGIFLPMYQSEALWMRFTSELVPAHCEKYLFAIKVATGKINAVSGDGWGASLIGSPQNYIISPHQPWLDGFCVGNDFIRQFVAAPLGSGYTVEEQVSGEAQHGGIQLEVYPMRRRNFEKFCKSRYEEAMRAATDDVLVSEPRREMAISLGGRLQQYIYADLYGIDSWDIAHASRVFVHITNSLHWRSVTGASPPTKPFTAKEYAKADLPWFDGYDERADTLKGAPSFAEVKSKQQIRMAKRTTISRRNDSTILGDLVRSIRKMLVQPQKNRVRESKT